MNEPGTYEERVGRSIDALYDTATILTGDRERAESLVVTAVVEASRRYRRDPPEGDFRRWILSRLIRQFLDYERDRRETGMGAPEAAREEPGGPALRGGGVPGPPATPDGLDALLAAMSDMEGRAPDRLAAAVRRGLSELALEDRMAIWLVNVMGFDYRDAAAAMDLQLPELRQRLFRGRRELQARVAVALQRELDRGRRAVGPG